MKPEELIRQAESQRLEFKESFGKEALETVAAFCNASGGTLVIGVDKRGKVKGVSVSEESLKDWVNQTKQATQPQIFPEISTVELEGKTIVTLTVQEYPVKPVSCRGKYFKRIGASNHQIQIDEIVEMQLFSVNSSFDSFAVDETVADLQMDVVMKFLKQLESTGRISLHSDPVMNLRRIGLLKQDQLTFAALMLFGEHHTGIRIGRFKTQDVIIDDILIHSPLVLAVDEAMNFIKKGISIRYEFTGELRRKEIWQYPLPVLRELLLNAIIHKDYRNPTDIMIKIFDDHIRFMNPGSLMGGLRVEDLLHGEYLAAHRNKLLAEAFYLRGDIEKFGTGFSRIRKWLEDYPELQFNFEALNGMIRSGLDNSSLYTGQNTPQDTPQDAPQDTPQVLRLIQILEGIKSRDEIQILLILSDREYFRKKYLRPALEMGYVEMTIPDKPNSKYQKYRLSDKGLKIKQQWFDLEQQSKKQRNT